MNADIINLRLSRKRKLRQDRETAAAENRLRHGRTKQQRKLQEAHANLSDQHLSGHKRDNLDSEK